MESNIFKALKMAQDEVLMSGFGTALAAAGDQRCPVDGVGALSKNAGNHIWHERIRGSF